MSTIITHEDYLSKLEDLNRRLTFKTMKYCRILKKEKEVVIPLKVAIEFGLKTLQPVNIDTEPKVKTPPRPMQVQIIKDLMEKIRTNVGVTLNADTGIGKTYMSLYIALALDIPTLIICPNARLPLQWYEAVKKIAGEKWAERNCKCYDKVKNIQDDLPFFLIVRNDICSRVDVSDYELIIVDELHLTYTDTGASALLECTGAKRLIGCTATIKSSPGHDMTRFFGSAKVTVEHNITFKFLAISTGLIVNDNAYWVRQDAGDTAAAFREFNKIENYYTDWPLFYKRVARELYDYAKDNKVLVICNHIDRCIRLAESINELFNRKNDTDTKYADTYVMDDSYYDGKAQFLIGTSQKVGTGFDQEANGEFDRRFDTVVIMNSIAKHVNIWQALGRVVRHDGEKRMIWFFHPSRLYEGHKNSAVQYMINKGATVENIDDFEHKMHKID